MPLKSSWFPLPAWSSFTSYQRQNRPCQSTPSSPAPSPAVLFRSPKPRQRTGPAPSSHSSREAFSTNISGGSHCSPGFPALEQGEVRGSPVPCQLLPGSPFPREETALPGGTVPQLAFSAVYLLLEHPFFSSLISIF
jgi:hypothetical protein